MYDLINRKDAIDLLQKWSGECGYIETRTEYAIKEFEDLPSAKPTLYGYNYYDLELIAIILQRENLSPDRVVECLTDIARIVEIVKGEFDNALRNALKGEENEDSN